MPTDHWAYKYVEYAYQNNVVKGTSATTYDPDTALDRGHMAVFLARSMVDPHGDDGLATYDPPAPPAFPTYRPTIWAYKHIEYVKSQNVTQGCGDGLYHPEIVCTRDQMAVFIMRAFGLPWD